MQVDNMNDMLDMFVDLSCDSFLWLVSKRPVHVIGCLPGCDTCALTTQEPYFKVIYFRYRNFEVYIWKVRQSSQNSRYSCTCHFHSAMCSKLLKQFSTKFSACSLQRCIETLMVFCSWTCCDCGFCILLTECSLCQLCISKTVIVVQHLCTWYLPVRAWALWKCV